MEASCLFFFFQISEACFVYFTGNCTLSTHLFFNFYLFLEFMLLIVGFPVVHPSLYLSLFFYFFFLFMAAPAVPGLGVNWNCSCRPTPQSQQHCIQTAFSTYATACGNAWSLTHWVSQGIEPTSSQTQVINPLSHNGNSHPTCPLVHVTIVLHLSLSLLKSSASFSCIPLA